MNPPLWLMAVAAFTVGCGMRMLDPLLPMLAREFGTGLGAVAPLIGGFALAYGLGQFAAGPLGDRFGKMRVVALAMAVYAATQIGAGMAEGLSGLLACRVLAGLAAAATVPLFMAHIGDQVPYAERQAVLGRFLTGMVAAQLMAGPLSGAIGEYAGWRWSFATVGVVALAITALFAVRLGREGWRPPPAGAAVGLAGFRRLWEKPSARRLMLGAAINGFLLFGGAFPFVASLLIQRFGLSAAAAGLVVAGFGLGSMVYTRSAGWLIRRLGEPGTALWGGVGVAVALAGIAVAPNWWVVAVLQAAVGLLFFMLHGVLQARSTEALPEARGTAVAGFVMALFLGQSVGSVVFGSLIAGVGFTAAFLFAAVAVLGLAAWLHRAIRE